MRRVVIFYKSYQKYGGQEKVIWNFSHYLAENNYLVDIYAAKIKDEPQHPNITVKKVFVPNLGRGLRTLIFALYACKKAKSYKDACVFGFGKTFYQDIYRSGGGVHKYYFTRAKLKYISKLSRALYTARKMLSLSHWVNIWIENKTYSDKHLKTVIVPSEFVKKQIKEGFEIDEDKIKIVRNETNLKLFDYKKRRIFKKELIEKLNFMDNDFIFSFVSTNHRLKGLDYLLDACKIAKGKGYEFKLLVAGNGDERYFKKRVEKLGLIRNVIWLGVVKDIEKVYCASDFFVYPTLFDTFGHVILESLSCGTPVLCSRYAGASEIIEDDVFIIKNPSDSHEIADKMIFALANKKRLDIWGKTARQTAANFDSATSSKRHLEFVEEWFKSRGH